MYKRQEPNFNLIDKITYAQNKKDLKALDKIASEISNGGGKNNFYLQYRLQNAYAWILHSNKFVPDEMKKKVKSLILDENWNRPAYHYLSQAVIFLDLDDAYYLVNSAFKAFHKNKKQDYFTLQFVAMIAVNYLNCCYYQKASKKYTDCAVEFLYSLPLEPTIGFHRMVGAYYEALFNNDLQMQKRIAIILKKISTIEDTLNKDIAKELNL